MCQTHTKIFESIDNYLCVKLTQRSSNHAKIFKIKNTIYFISKYKRQLTLQSHYQPESHKNQDLKKNLH